MYCTIRSCSIRGTMGSAVAKRRQFSQVRKDRILQSRRAISVRQ